MYMDDNPRAVATLFHPNSNVVPFDPLLRSWVIMNLPGDIVTKDPKIVCKALGAIKSTLWKSESFHYITNQCLATAGIEGGASEQAFKAILSHDLCYTRIHGK
jgi:hypothetical protein